MSKKKILIVGSNLRSFRLAKKLLRKPGCHVVGYADDHWECLQYVEGQPVATTMPVTKVCAITKDEKYDDIESYIKKNALDQVLITLPIKGGYEHIAKILSLCAEKKIEAKFSINLFNSDYNYDDDYDVTVEPPQNNLITNKWIELTNNIVLFLKKNRHPHEYCVLIVGANNLRALSLAESLRQSGSGYKFIGYAEDAAEEIPEWMPVKCRFVHGNPEGFVDFVDYISKNPVDEVLFALPVKKYYTSIKKMIGYCKEQGVRIRIIDDFFSRNDKIPQYIDSDAKAKFFDKFKVNKRSLFKYDIKWLFDRTAAAVLIVLFLPVLLAVSLAVFLDDGRPVFYKQERVGRNKRRFEMIKFRTMVRDAEKMQAELEDKNEIDTGVAFKITNDPRVTRLGKWLRKTSLDELPQLFNVLKADMSLVGPRPLPVRDFKKFYNNSHRIRFSVDPGITGPWQISGRSDNIDFDEWMKLEFDYVDNWRLRRDIQILLKTVPAVLFCRGAK